VNNWGPEGSTFRGSTMVVQHPVKVMVVGSSPTRGATPFHLANGISEWLSVMLASLSGRSPGRVIIPTFHPRRKPGWNGRAFLRSTNRIVVWLLTRIWGFEASLKGSTYGSQEARRQVATLKTQVRILSVRPSHAVVAQRLAHNLAKVGVEGSNPFYCSHAGVLCITGPGTMRVSYNGNYLWLPTRQWAFDSPHPLSCPLSSVWQSVGFVLRRLSVRSRQGAPLGNIMVL
jgi:hypothetical protein